jgi:RNA polymerase sigma-70 factor (ECF subfamily)
MEIDELMARYQQADSAATTALIRHVSPMLYRYFASEYGRTRADAEDLLQDTWLQIHKVRQTYRPGEPVLPWIYAIARHVKIDGFRKKQRVQSREVAAALLPEVPAPPAALEPAGDFQSLIAALPPSQREVITMLKVTGMSLEEVARATASTVGSVKLKAHRAYTKLRSVLR